MKQILIAALLILSSTTYGQNIGGININSSAASSINECLIHYTYDATGCRIKRDRRCEEPPEDHGGGFRANLYPNPSTGPITISFDELVINAVLNIYDMEGSLVGTSQSEMGYSMEYDVSEFVPGSYVVIVNVTRESGELASDEFILIKPE